MNRAGLEVTYRSWKRVEATDEELTGGCACGAVRYRMTTAPMFVHCCHCLDCQRQTGSAFVINALIETARLDVEGADPERFEMPTDSGRPHGIYSCQSCGTAVWSEYGGLATLRFVRVGTLDEPQLLVPDVHIYTRSKVPVGHAARGRARVRRLLRRARALVAREPRAAKLDPPRVTARLPSAVASRTQSRQAPP